MAVTREVIRGGWGVGGDGAAVHGLRSRRSNRAHAPEVREQVLALTAKLVYAGFGPTLLAEHARGRLGVCVSADDGAGKRGVGGAGASGRSTGVGGRGAVLGELLQWDSSVHPWLKDRGPDDLVLVALHDDATTRMQNGAFRCARHGRGKSRRAIIKCLLAGRGKMGWGRRSYSSPAPARRPARERAASVTSVHMPSSGTDGDCSRAGRAAHRPPSRTPLRGSLGRPVRLPAHRRWSSGAVPTCRGPVVSRSAGRSSSREARLRPVALPWGSLRVQKTPTGLCRTIQRRGAGPPRGRPPPPRPVWELPARPSPQPDRR